MLDEMFKTKRARSSERRQVGAYEVEVRAEEERECGYRHSGEGGCGLYLVSDGIGMHCDRLPFILLNSEGEPIKHFRGVKEIDPLELFHDNAEPIKDACTGLCAYCPMGGMRQNYGIIQFVGGDNYSIDGFNSEASRMGISRRISDVPNSFVFGQHWVYLAHLDGGSYLNPLSGQMERAPAIFKVFKPRLEIVIDDPNAIPDRAKELKDRYGANATIVKVVPI